MCELFAMSSSIPTEVSFSLDEFSRHGGLTDQHKDGWGIAYYDKNDVRIIKEACSASESAYLRFVKDHSIQSHLIISHIRFATLGEISVRNTQPFSRELSGKQHVFAHNGDLPDLQPTIGFKLKRFQPIGTTDSELAFCYLMDKMAMLWDQRSSPNLAQRYQVIEAFSKEISAVGISNFIYSDSDFIFIHSHKRVFPQQSINNLPGLYFLCRSCPANQPKQNIDGLELKAARPQHVVLAASVPLSKENWIAMQDGEILVLQHGEIIQKP